MNSSWPLNVLPCSSSRPATVSFWMGSVIKFVGTANVMVPLELIRPRPLVTLPVGPGSTSWLYW